MLIVPLEAGLREDPLAHAMTHANRHPAALLRGEDTL
jgi:hypothetical protein